MDREDARLLGEQTGYATHVLEHLKVGDLVPVEAAPVFCTGRFGCGRLLPASQFRESGRNVCDECWERRSEVHRALNGEAKLKRDVERFIDQASQDCSAPHINQLCADAAREFGGTLGIAKYVKRIADESMAEGKTSVALKAVTTVVRMIEVASKMQDEALDTFRMADDELKKAQIDLIAKVLKRNGMTIQYKDEALEKDVEAWADDSDNKELTSSA